MKKDIAGMVILYHPDETELLRNVSSYLPFIDRLYIIDNTEGGADAALLKKLQGLPGVEITGNQYNAGVAATLNQGARQALQNNYGWLLTMDQDSYFDTDAATTYFHLFNQQLAAVAEIALVSPRHFPDHNGQAVAPVSDVNSVMTSGNLLRLARWNEVNGFDEKLFIDEVDHEYCYRIRQKKYRIVQLNEVELNHQLGKQKLAGYPGNFAKRSRRIHSPGRVYFMVRNYLYVRKKYRKLFPDDFRQRDKGLLVTIKNNLFFSGHFLETLKNIRKGYADFKKGNFANGL